MEHESEEIKDGHPSREQSSHQHFNERLASEFAYVDEETHHSKQAENGEQKESQTTKGNITEILIGIATETGAPCG